jgi:hypothetical protein
MWSVLLIITKVITFLAKGGIIVRSQEPTLITDLHVLVFYTRLQQSSNKYYTQRVYVIITDYCFICTEQILIVQANLLTLKDSVIMYKQWFDECCEECYK